jgi:hypothetical protein
MSLTPLAGSPIRIVRGLNRFSEVAARLIVLDPNNYGSRTFEDDLIWDKDREESLALLRDCDIVHLHHFMHLDTNPFGIDLHKWTRAGTKFVHQFQSTPGFIARRLYGGDQRIIEEMVHHSTIPQLVIPHLQERFYPRARVVPQIIPIDDELYTPFEPKAEHPVIVFSPSVSMSAWFSENPEHRWESKGYPETRRLLEKVTAGIPGSSHQIIQDRPHFECLAERRRGHIAIDEMVSGSFHLCSFESLSQGLPTFAYLDERTLQVLAELTGIMTHPWMNFKIEDSERPLKTLLLDGDLRQQIGHDSRRWMEKHWNPRTMVQHYVRAYHDLMENPDSFKVQRFDLSNRCQMWHIRDSFDINWEKRALAGRSESEAADSAASCNTKVIKAMAAGPRWRFDDWSCTEQILLHAPRPICIVGNAAMKQQFGSAIDSYATVIRMNNFRIQGFETTVGSKTDYRCVSGWNDVENRNEHIEFSPFTAGAFESGYLDSYNTRNLRQVVTAVNNVHPFITEVPNPSTGFALVQLFDMLDIPVDLFGFDGFQSGHYWGNQKLETTHSTKEIDCILRRRKVTLYTNDTTPIKDLSNWDGTVDEKACLPGNFFIKEGYQPRNQAEYFEDTSEKSSEATWQPDVYPLADELGMLTGCSKVIDVGCGHAQKLVQLHPKFEIIGVDYGANLDYCRQQYNFGRWIEWDLELPACPPIEDDVVSQSIIICADVIEHLIDPSSFLRYIRFWLERSPIAILSTPERDLTRGASDVGPPGNAAHVREWNRGELQLLLQAAGIGITYCGLTRNNDIDCRDETIVCILQKKTSQAIADAAEGWLNKVKRSARRVGLFGASSRGRTYVELLASTDQFSPCCFFDNNPEKWGRQFENLPVFPPQSKYLKSVDVVLISSVYSDEIKEQLTKLGMARRIALDVPDLLHPKRTT